MVERLTQAVPALQTAYTLGTSFMTMVKTRDHAAYEGWISAARQSGIGELHSFAVGLEQDGAAVRAALRLPWSNGQVEGQVNRLKLIKRMAYGRAKARPGRIKADSRRVRENRNISGKLKQRV